MRELNIRGFINEMSYDLSMQELEALVLDYQDVLIDFVVNNQYNYKSKKEFSEVCELIRTNRFIRTIAGLINSEDSRIVFDMAYVLYVATHQIEDKELANEAFALGYKLRSIELEGQLTDHPETNIAIIIASVKTVRGYNVTPFFRSKEVENVLENLPEVLYNAYSKKYAVQAVNESVLATLLSKAIVDLEPEEFLTACCKSCVPVNIDEKYVPYVKRIQAFLYKVAGALDDEKFDKALNAACHSIAKFNERTGRHETFMDKYLNYRLLEAVVQKGENVPQLMQVAYNKMKRFKYNNPKFKQLF